jgi:hypothetical protein
MSRQPRPQLDEVIAAYVQELPDWPDTAEAVQLLLSQPVGDPYTAEERAARIRRVLEAAGEPSGGTEAVECCGRQLDLFADRQGDRYVWQCKSDLIGGKKDRWFLMLVRQAYMDVHQGYSIDRLIADPDRNFLFVHRCWQLGLQASQYELNWSLLAARKSGLIGSVPGVEAYRVPRSRLDEYLFASELALRVMQDKAYFEQQVSLSLDQILCDPSLASEFEGIARRLAPGYSALDYRWAAITIRKSQQRSVSLAGRPEPVFEALGRTRDVRVSKLPKVSGFFWFHCDGADVYFGHAENLRSQVDRLLQIEDAGTRVIPQWIYDGDLSGMELAIAPCPGVSPSKREPVKTSYVATREPLFNVVPRVESVA